MASLVHSLFCIVILVQLPFFISAQSNITLGSTKSNNPDETPYWTSPSGDFAFGFHPQQPLLAIWFDKIPQKTVVWTANQGRPVERGATIQLTANGVLSLRTPNGTEIWKAQSTTGNIQVAYAAMLDTGNFVLASAQSTIAWASFDNPTDTILPTQTIQLGGDLVSRLTDNDYTPGKFKLAVQGDGNLVLYTLARPTDGNNEAYWSSDTVNNGSQLVFNQSGYLYLTLKSGGLFYLSSETPISTRDNYQRATLDFDGVIRQYTYPKTSATNGNRPEVWSASWSVPNNICAADVGQYGSGICGFNSYCTLNEVQRPECRCPPGYSYIDPNNTFRGCKQNFLPQICATNGSTITDGFEMQELASADWPFADYEWFQSVDEEFCRRICLNDCFCAAAIIREGSCWLKKFPLSRGFMRPGFRSKALIKVGEIPSTGQFPSSDNIGGNDKDENKWMIPVFIILGISIVLNLLILVLALYHKGHKKKVEIQNDTRTSGANLRSFTYKELEEATDGFKEELGMGAFSTVFKGMLKSDFGRLVAVKRLDRVVEGRDKEFKAEVNSIGKTNHKNLVQLLGFCEEEGKQLLVYEFMMNGSLENFLFRNSKLKWNQRVQIALGIARGLAYLHEDCSTQIIHCDVKPQNILLDECYVARISDFGLAKLLQGDQTRTLTGIRGTRGYVAPEWFRNTAITAKVDVYSFGIMLLEIICCRKNAEIKVGEEDVEMLSEIAYECCEEKALHVLVGDDEEAKNDGKNLERMVMVALWCIQEDPFSRPSMKKVTNMLEGAVEVSMPPSPYSFNSSVNILRQTR